MCFPFTNSSLCTAWSSANFCCCDCAFWTIASNYNNEHSTLQLPKVHSPSVLPFPFQCPSEGVPSAYDSNPINSVQKQLLFFPAAVSLHQTVVTPGLCVFFVPSLPSSSSGCFVSSCASPAYSANQPEELSHTLYVLFSCLVVGIRTARSQKETMIDATNTEYAIYTLEEIITRSP